MPYGIETKLAGLNFNIARRTHAYTVYYKAWALNLSIGWAWFDWREVAGLRAKFS